MRAERKAVEEIEGPDSDDESDSDSSDELDKYGQKMDSGYKEEERKQDCLIKRSVDLTTQLYDVGWYVKSSGVDPVKQIVQRMRDVHQWLTEKSENEEMWKLLRGSPYKAIALNPDVVVKVLKPGGKTDITMKEKADNQEYRRQVQSGG